MDLGKPVRRRLVTPITDLGAPADVEPRVDRDDTDLVDEAVAAHDADERQPSR